MDAGKEMLQQDKAKLAAELVGIVFIDSENFNIIATEDEIDKTTKLVKIHKGEMKYNGKIIGPKPHIDDYCTCPSQFHRNNKQFQDEHGYAFQCKHLEQARAKRYQGHEQ